MKEIVINGKGYAVRQTLRSLFIYEELAGKPFSGKNLADMYLLCYSTLLASNPDSFTMTFADFIDACDADPEIFRTYTAMLIEKNRIDKQDSADSSKKKEETAPSVSENFTAS